MANKYLIALDDGHGMNTPGKRTPPLTKDLYIDGKLVRKKGEVIKENEFNRAVVKYLAEALKRCGFDVLLVAPTDEDTPLSTRVSRANNANADAYVSKHYNALGSRWQTKAKGLVTIIHYNHQSKTKVLANNVHEELWKLHSNHNCTNYGVRTDTDISGYSLYVLRNTKMPAILTESGFMDNMTEAVDMLDTNFQQADAEATCKGICKAFGVTYVKPNEEETTCKEKDVEVNTDIKYVRVIYDGLLNVRKCPSWNDDVVVGTVKKDEVFTVMKKVKVEDSYMYKLKSGLYITASSKYVEGLKSI
ncbi:MAG: N-acetylmuramoyl-L-alanine amidase [Clostridiales bacterium]|uniref:N-acetylmuramoyl-L-alanine amidase family protein n=1 Tax=Terrisporobacter sp. TaxID=1965305 RepID=UPI002A38DA11|nr:N-acetylmuramoyl-L-alanine amidase [Terrisporobacter sp.]MCI5629075.1 N-acetylmuramoyl-L-alanine amidase [Clostridium sp.]MDD5879481.1 N-acetylmuramoyl-L-alanine amidase [Clostridiales bacterium]MCI6459663.1 N-acetylmuramoyl-L-alanine amidase [Clostridium sp.]MCI7207576.1 N-acetylmuramoyl-L-alanine amidase [Clostridium sp.]MDD7755943.1 N-acetylmuramoyl-L-alanine amidase [Clostridiales bacterium]